MQTERVMYRGSARRPFSGHGALPGDPCPCCRRCRKGCPMANGAEHVDTRLAGVTFLLIGAGFLTVSMLAASIAVGYDFHGGAISDLGVIDATAALFNVLLVACGVLNAA